MSVFPPYQLRHITRIRKPGIIRSDWPAEVEERWWPLYRLLRLSGAYFTDYEVGRLIELKAGLSVGGNDSSGEVGLD